MKDDDVYGSPHLNDTTADREKRIQEYASASVERVQKEGPIDVLNRALGSKPVSTEDQRLDFENRGATPDYWPRKFWGYTARGMGLERAVLSLLEDLATNGFIPDPRKQGKESDGR